MRATRRWRVLLGRRIEPVALAAAIPIPRLDTRLEPSCPEAVLYAPTAWAWANNPDGARDHAARRRTETTFG